MPFLDHHWTDADIAAFAQPHIDEVMARFRFAKIEVTATTFFVDAGLAGDPELMRADIHRKLMASLPPEIAGHLRPEVMDVFQVLGDICFRHDEKLKLVYSRPDSRLSLAERVSNRSGIPLADVDIDSRVKSCRFDNFELMERILEAMQGYLNGGADHLKAMSQFDIIQYRSMLGAKRNFLSLGGDRETIELHEATAHTGAFLRGDIHREYTGFMADFGMREAELERVFGRIMDRMAEKGYTVKTPLGDMAQFSLPGIENFLKGMSELLDEYSGRINPNGGIVFKAFYNIVCKGHATPEEHAIVSKLTASEIAECTEHYIVYQALKGARLIMGDNVLKYVPARSDDPLGRMDRLLAFRHQ